MSWRRFFRTVFLLLLPSTPTLAQNINVGRLLRFSCSQLVIERTDPLVSPGSVPSPHVHQIVGGDSFNATMDPADLDPARDSTCTSCTYAQDFSNYWTASLYFRSPENGSYRMVPQQYNFVGLDGERHPQNGGGITVYYMTAFGPGAGSQRVTAFRPGFRMIAGDPSSTQQNSRGICHRCTGDSFPGAGAPCANSATDTSAFPDRPCPGGIRATITFPSCWDGKNLDSPDHAAHMAYSTDGVGVLAGTGCPASHPVRVPQLMYEVAWNTSAFNRDEYFGKDGEGRQPFVYSFGDGSGHGQHGDYLFGWKDDSLQRAMDAVLRDDYETECLNDRCSALEHQTVQQANACTKKSQVPDDVVGLGGEWLDALPGNNVPTS